MNKSPIEQLREFAEKVKGYTAGPWFWFGQQAKNGVGSRFYLATGNRGRLTIMDFVRLGMQRAMPRFAKRNDSMGGIMYPISELAKFDHSGELTSTGNADADLLAIAPELLNLALTLADQLEKALADQAELIEALDSCVVELSNIPGRNTPNQYSAVVTGAKLISRIEKATEQSENEGVTG